MPPRRSNRHVSSLIGAKRPVEDPPTPPATEESQIPVPVPKKRGRGRPPTSSQFTIAEDATATQQSQQQLSQEQLSQQQSSQRPFLRETPLKANRQEDKIPWNTPPTDYKPMSVPHREPEIHLPDGFDCQQKWASPAAFFDLYLPDWLLEQIAETLTNIGGRTRRRTACARAHG